MYGSVNTSLTTNALERYLIHQNQLLIRNRLSQCELLTHSRSVVFLYGLWSMLTYGQCSNLSIHGLCRTFFFFHCLETQRSLDKNHNFAPPLDTHHHSALSSCSGAAQLSPKSTWYNRVTDQGTEGLLEPAQACVQRR